MHNEIRESEKSKIKNKKKAFWNDFTVFECFQHHPVICPSLHHYQTPPTMLPSAEYLSKVYGYDLGEANFSSGSTYNSLEGVAGDSISFTHLDSYDSGDSVPRFPVPMNIALCLAEARLPTLGYENGCKGLYAVNDTPAVNRIQDAPLDLSSCYVKAEPTVKEERDRCCDLLQQNNGCRRNELPRKTQDVCACHHRLCPHTVPALHQQRKCDIKAEGMAPVYTQSAVKPEKKMENGEQDPRRENPDCAGKGSNNCCFCLSHSQWNDPSGRTATEATAICMREPSPGSVPHHPSKRVTDPLSKEELELLEKEKQQMKNPDGTSPVRNTGSSYAVLQQKPFRKGTE